MSDASGLAALVDFERTHPAPVIATAQLVRFPPAVEVSLHDPSGSFGVTVHLPRVDYDAWAARFLARHPEHAPRHIKTWECAVCGSRDVRRDADVAWCVETQTWELAGVYDAATCDECGSPAKLKEVEVDL